MSRTSKTSRSVRSGKTARRLVAAGLSAAWIAGVSAMLVMGTAAHAL